ncbi:MAG: glycosyltransferase family 39 protein [Chloroflexota bacterium]
MFIIDLLITAVVIGSVWSTGRLIIKALNIRTESCVIDLVLSLGLGVGILVYVQMICGFGGSFSTLQAWLTVGCMCGLGVFGLISYKPIIKFERVSELIPSSVLDRLLLLGIAIMSILYLLVALAPTLDGDSLAGYLVVARDFAKQGRVFSATYAYTNLFPANGQLIAALGFSLKGQIVAQLFTVWFMGVLVALGLYSLGTKLFNSRISLIGVFAWYSMASVAVLSASVKVDLIWAAFEIISIIAFAQWYFAGKNQRDWKWLLITGLFLGLAFGTKQATAFTSIILATGVAYRLYSDKNLSLKVWSLSFLSIILFALPGLVWVMRSVVISGSLGFSGSGLAGETGFSGFFIYLWDMSMLGNSNSIEGPNGKSIGPIFLSILPCVIFLRNVDNKVWHVTLYSLVMLLISFFVVQRARHILPALGLMSLIAGYVINRLSVSSPRLGSFIITAVLLASLVSTATWTYTNFVSIETFQRSLNIIDDHEYFTINLENFSRYPGWEIIRASNDLTDEKAVIGSPGASNGFYLNRPLLSFSQTEKEFGVASEFVEILKQNDVTHVYINEFVVNERGHESSWLVNEGFQDKYLLEIICSRGQCLYELR